MTKKRSCYILQRRNLPNSPPYLVSKQCDQKKSPNVYKSCPNMISLEKLKILTHLQKLPKIVRDMGKLIVAKGFKKFYKVQKSPNLVTLCPIRNATGTTCGHLIIKGLNFRPFPKKFTKYFEPFPVSFFFIFVFSIQFIVNKIANDGIWTVDLWFR